MFNVTTLRNLRYQSGVTGGPLLPSPTWFPIGVYGSHLKCARFRTVVMGDKLEAQPNEQHLSTREGHVNDDGLRARFNYIMVMIGGPQAGS